MGGEGQRRRKECWIVHEMIRGGEKGKFLGCGGGAPNSTHLTAEGSIKG